VQPVAAGRGRTKPPPSTDRQHAVTSWVARALQRASRRHTAGMERYRGSLDRFTVSSLWHASAGKKARAVKKSHLAAVASKSWNIALATYHFLNVVCKSGISEGEILVIRRVVASRRAFQKYGRFADLRCKLCGGQFCGTKPTSDVPTLGSDFAPKV
jgi:hypothetical protein